MSDYINWNGRIVNKNEFNISVDNRSFRYGDGFFETMKVNDMQIALEPLHFERFFMSLNLLQFDLPSFFTPLFFREQIHTLLTKNNHRSLSRVRLMIYRGDGGPYDPENNFPNFIIQSWPLNNDVEKMNGEGLKIDVYKDGRKTYDKFSIIKSNNYLPYLMGALYVRKNKLNDAFILNAHDRIADATIANVFIVQNGIIKTPPLSEGCISGVYRKYLIQSFKKDNIPYVEEPVTESDLQNASEIFLTNAINGIRWVYSCGNLFYKNETTASLYNMYSKLSY